MLFLIFTKPRTSEQLDLKSQRLRRAKFNEGLGWAVLSLMALSACMFISSKVSAQAIEPEAGAGQLLFKQGEALHLGTDVKASIAGMVAKITYTQRFENRSPHWQEATYLFPLPSNAAVNALLLKVGERTIVGEVKEKHQAQQIYHQAKQQGKKAALLAQQRSNLFRQQVSNIAPGEKVTVEISFVQTLRYHQGVFEWRLPTTLTPRYAPVSGPVSAPIEEFGEHDSNSRDTASVLSPMATQTQVENALTLQVELAAGLPLANIEALYHKISVSKQGDLHHIAFMNPREPMDRDVVLQWRAIASTAPTTAIFKESVNIGQSEQVDGEYWLMMVLPPTEKSNSTYLPRDMVFVIDVSGSMQGSSIRQAKRSLAMALTRLKPDDRFNIVAFNSSYSQLFPNLQYADLQTIRQAESWINGLQADGGTEMYPALEAALHSMEQDSQRVKQVLFITDGAVANEQALFELIYKNLNEARLFTIGIGSAPNSFFMKKAAQFGRGSFTFIGDVNETLERMNELFNKIENVAATDLSVAWPSEVEAFPKKVPDLFAGEPLLLLAKSQGMTGDIIVEGKIAEQAWRKDLAIPAVSIEQAGIATLWARRKIGSLQDEIVEGRPVDEVRAEVLPLALAHQLVTPYSSFVAVEQSPSRPENESLDATAVPNLVPRGQQMTQLAYPSTASAMPLYFLIGFMFAVASLLLKCRPFTRRVLN